MNYIKEYWEDQARTHGDSHVASWGDNFMLDLEFEAIRKWVVSGDVVLDVGCANGFSSFRQFESCRVKSMIGIDFSDQMIKEANETKKKRGLEDEIRFQVGDVRSIDFPDNSFDLVYTTRVLINLPTWEEQITGIEECFRVAKPDGKVIFSEAFWEPLMLLNSFRSLCNLPLLVEHDFNRYLKKSQLEKYLTGISKPFQVDEFSSIYYLGSRLVREMATNPADYPGFTNPINKLFFDIEKEFSCNGIGIQQAYIIDNMK